jgi:DNA-binding response OmpR family regulator
MLSRKGFIVVTASDAMQGLREAYKSHPDVIILDVMMPKMDGFEACRRLREMTDTPILFLTGQATTTDDVVKGLNLGADEYMTKPFRSDELISRLFVCLRRGAGRSEERSDYISLTPSICLDCARHELILGNRSVYLPPREFEVLRLLMHHAGRVLSLDAILAQVWGPERIGETGLVKQYIYQLRQRIEPNPQEPIYLHSVRGGGYYFFAGDAD